MKNDASQQNDLKFQQDLLKVEWNILSKAFHELQSCYFVPGHWALYGRVRTKDLDFPHWPDSPQWQQVPAGRGAGYPAYGHNTPTPHRPVATQCHSNCEIYTAGGFIETYMLHRFLNKQQSSFKS